jgi:hypothetical protein
MSFKVLECAALGAVTAIPEGMVSLDKRGQARMHASDLAKVKITTSATILADSSTMRVGFRKPRPEEKPFKISGEDAKSKRPSDRRRVNVSPALAELRIDSDKAKGRYVLHEHRDLLFFCLAEVPGEPEAGDDDESEDEDAS